MLFDTNYLEAHLDNDKNKNVEKTELFSISLKSIFFFLLWQIFHMFILSAISMNFWN